MIELSLSEFEALARRAIAGAGHPWGLAEEGAAAVRWLAERGRPGGDALATWIDTGAAGRADCPLRAAAAISDCLGSGRPGLAIAAVQQPLLLLPAVDALCAAGLSSALALDGRAPAAEGALAARAAVRAWRTPGRRPAPPGTHTRARLTAGSAALLQRAAARLLVPASEGSRLGGAGAGLRDND